MKCVVCETPLTGGTDTFGDVNYEMCMSCWFEVRQDGLMIDQRQAWRDTFSIVTNLDEQATKPAEQGQDS